MDLFVCAEVSSSCATVTIDWLVSVNVKAVVSIGIVVCF